MSESDYQSLLDWLYGLRAGRGMRLGLDRIRAVLQRLGDPQRRFAAVHIAGTNGKGSVAAMVHSVLHAAGLRTGLYTSPHLVRFTERIRVGEREISPPEVIRLVAEARAAADAAGVELTFFEYGTVIAFLHFARCGVDVAVVEVGLGGRLDATNVVDPLVAVVTSIGRDHSEFLGRTIAAIAAEKGGIIKPGRPVVLGRLRPTARRVLRRLASTAGAPVVESGRDYRMEGDTPATFIGVGTRIADLRPGLRGGYQRDNAATAVATLVTLRSALPVPDEAIRSGLATVRWPGRFEVVAESPLTILDGAHNSDGMRRLVLDLEPLVRGRSLHVLFAVMRDKNGRAMARLLGPLCRSVTVTEVYPPRGLPVTRAARLFARCCPTRCDPDPRRAWVDLRAAAAPDDVVLATGSLFLVGVLHGASHEEGGPDFGRSGR